MARPVEQHEPAARHNDARLAYGSELGRACRLLFCNEHFVPKTSEGAARSPKKLSGAAKKSLGMTRIAPDSAYVSRPMVPDAAQWMTPPPSEYQTRIADANSSTLPRSLTTEQADKSEQTPELPRKDRQALLSPRLKSKSSTPAWLQWSELDNTDIEAKGSSANNKRKAHFSRTSMRRSRGIF